MAQVYFSDLVPLLYTAWDVGAKVLSCKGEDSQTQMAIEECGELITALCHYRRGRAQSSDVAGEIADVLIMALQLTKMHGADDVLAALKDKTARMRNIIHDLP